MPLAPECHRRAPGGRTARQRPAPGGWGPRPAPGNRLRSLSQRLGCTSTSRLIMATTRLFRNGNSQAVRIPAELAYERSDMELEIERCGDELRIRPAGRPITGALQALASFSPSFLAAGRNQDEQQERESL
jgi:antitoxin VapB